jgi:hypothetical protein
MTKQMHECELIGRWRITGADLWDRNYIDLCGPAILIIAADGHGEITFGALQAGLDLEYARTAVFFEWVGFDEMDEVCGSGSAELQDDGSLPVRPLTETTSGASKRRAFGAWCGCARHLWPLTWKNRKAAVIALTIRRQTPMPTPYKAA